MKVYQNWFKKRYWPYRGRLKDFFVSVFGGFFSGLVVGIFFSLVTDTTFNGWINPLKLGELVALTIYTLFTFLLLVFFYKLGDWGVKLSIGNSSRSFSFYLNYIAGAFSSTTVFLFTLYYDVPLIRNTIAIIFVITFFLLAEFTIRKKWLN